MKIRAVIPAYFERENIPELTERLTVELEKIEPDFGILYIIQGNDGSRQYLQSLSDKRISHLYFPEPLGVAKAFLLGFKEAVGTADFILTMDADLNHQPEEIKHLWLRRIETGADIVIGSRYIRGGKIIGMPLWKNLASRIMNKLINFFSGISVADKTSGFRIYTSQAVECVLNSIRAQNFEFYPEVIIIANQMGLSLAETPITFRFRTRGKSKMYKWQTIKGYISLFFNKITGRENRNENRNKK